jgi:hypothetical protein
VFDVDAGGGGLQPATGGKLADMREQRALADDEALRQVRFERVGVDFLREQSRSV